MSSRYDRKTLWRLRNVERQKRIWQPGYGRKQSPRRGSSVCPDRLTPSGANVDFSLPNREKEDPPSPTEYRKRLSSNLFREQDPLNRRVLRFNNQTVRDDREASPSEQYAEGAFEEYSDRRLELPDSLRAYKYQTVKCSNVVHTDDRFEDLDDLLGNLIDWNSRNILAIALYKKLYIWNGNVFNIQAQGHPYEILYDITIPRDYSERDSMISIAWDHEGKYVALGMVSGQIQIWDTEAKKMVTKCVVDVNKDGEYPSSLAWRTSKILTCGSSKGRIMNFDASQRSTYVTSKFRVPHKSVVRGLKWSSSNQYLASADANGLMCIWDVLNMGSSHSSPNFLHSIDAHEEEIKGLDWKSKTLVSAGISDNCIKIWNAALGQEERRKQTHSGVYSVLWNNSRDDVLMTAHGENGNYVTLWKYPEMHAITQVGRLRGPVTNMAQSPDGTKIATLCEQEEQLCIWDISSPLTFNPIPSRREDNDDPSKIFKDEEESLKKNNLICGTRRSKRFHIF